MIETEHFCFMENVCSAGGSAMVPEFGPEASGEEVIRAYRRHQVVLVRRAVRSVGGRAAAERHSAFVQRHKLGGVALDESSGALAQSGCWYRSALVSGEGACAELEALMPSELQLVHLDFHRGCFWLFWCVIPILCSPSSVDLCAAAPSSRTVVSREGE